ncbi:MAG: ABC transporter permease [Archangium sp.]
MLNKALVLVRIAVANIFSSMLNVFVGLVLLFGAALLVVGGSVFGTLDGALSKSIVGSIAGHMQVYGAKSKDPLELYGKMDGTDSDLTPIEDYKALKSKLLTVPNIERVVPMGASTALVASGNTIDLTLEKFRSLVNSKDTLPPDEYEKQKNSLIGHVRQMGEVLSKDIERSRELTNDDDTDARTALATAQSDEFWNSFDADPLGHLEVLENKLAPVMTDADLLFIRFIGTDLAAYQKTFDRMTIVEGTAVPEGHRGILLPRFFTEEYLKLKNARRLDKIREGKDAGRTIADDKELQRFVRENQAQTREIVLQLDTIATTEVIKKLQDFLEVNDAELPALLTRLFTVDDDNFSDRYAFFYKELAPKLSLYRVRVGDTMTLRSFGRSGAVNTVLVKVYGVFEFGGLEKSPLAGSAALTDLVTFRELYGYLTAEKKAELDALKAETNARQVTRENAEADLFGGDSELVQEAQNTTFDDALPGGQTAKSRRLADTFPVEEIDDGVVLNAAVWLKDQSPYAQLETQREVEKLLGAEAPPVNQAALDAAKKLAGGKISFPLAAAINEVVKLEEARAKNDWKPEAEALLALKSALKGDRAQLSDADIKTVETLLESARPKTWVVSWNSAAGFLGNIIGFFRLALVAIVVAFAFFALIVVTIGMTIATLQRTPTIGTMRAIGAQRTFVIGMVFIETVMLALAFGLIGAGIGALAVGWLHSSGIPAFRDELYFFFSGPVLRPELTAAGVVTAIVVTLVVSVLSIIFPLVLATRVSPITAMQSSEA